MIDADKATLYRGTSGSASELLAALLKGESHKAEEVKADETLNGSVKDTPDVPIATEPTPTPTPTPTVTETPSPNPTEAASGNEGGEDSKDGKSGKTNRTAVIVFSIIVLSAVLISLVTFYIIKKKKRAADGNGDFPVNS